MTNANLLLEDLRTNGPQSSWDWEADYRFAVAIGQPVKAKRIESALNSPSSIYARWMMVNVTGIPGRRLAAMRRLIKRGLVSASWEGTGPGGLSELGCSRVRKYQLVEGEKS